MDGGGAAKENGRKTIPKIIIPISAFRSSKDDAKKKPSITLTFNKPLYVTFLLVFLFFGSRQPTSSLPFDFVLKRTVQKIYALLEHAMELLPKMPLVDRKRTLLTTLLAARELLLKLHVLGKDYENAYALSKVMNLCEELGEFEAALFRAPDSLFASFQAIENVRWPALNVANALHLLDAKRAPIPAAISALSEDAAYSILLTEERFSELLDEKIAIKLLPLQFLLQKGFGFGVTGGVLTVTHGGNFTAKFTFDLKRNSWLFVWLELAFDRSLRGVDCRGLVAIGDLDASMDSSLFLLCVVDRIMLLALLLQLEKFRTEAADQLAIVDAAPNKLLFKLWRDCDVDNWGFFEVIVRSAAPRLLSADFVDSFCFSAGLVRCSFSAEVSCFGLGDDLHAVFCSLRSNFALSRLKSVFDWASSLFAPQVLFRSDEFCLLSFADGVYLLTIDKSSGKYRLCKSVNGPFHQLLECATEDVLFDRLFNQLWFLWSIDLRYQLSMRNLNYTLKSAYDAQTECSVACLCEPFDDLEFGIAMKKGFLVSHVRSRITGEVLEGFTYGFDQLSLGKHLDFKANFLKKKFVSDFSHLFGDGSLSLFDFEGSSYCSEGVFLRVASDYASFFNESPEYFCIRSRKDGFLFKFSKDGLFESPRKIVDLVAPLKYWIDFLKVKFYISSNVSSVCFTFDSTSVKLDFVKRVVTIDDSVDISFGIYLNHFFHGMQCEMLVAVLHVRQSLTEYTGGKHRSRLIGNFGLSFSLMFDTIWFKAKLKIKQRIFLLEPTSNASAVQSLCSVFTVTELFEFDGSNSNLFSCARLALFIDTIKRLDQSFEKFCIVENVLIGLLSGRRVSKSGRSLFFNFQTVSCSFELKINEGLIFDQVFINGPEKKIFENYVVSEILSTDNVKALLVSIYHLFRTSELFIRDYCKVISGEADDSSVKVILPFVLPAALCGGLPHQSTISYNANTRCVTFLVLFLYPATKRQYPVLLLYNLINNTLSIPEKYRLKFTYLSEFLDEISSGVSRKETQLFNYLNKVKSRIYSMYNPSST